jgi:peptide/nickel transport system ATP-binding protein
MSEAPQPALKIRDLSVDIATDEGSAQILDRAGLVLEAGSIHGVVGESGCGKSTLLKAILGVLPARSRIEAGSSIRLRGRELVGLSRQAMQQEVRGRDIGFIPQDPYQALNPVFPVETQLMESLATHGLRTASARSRGRGAMRAHLLSLLKAVQLADAAEALSRYPHQFSGGQRQRLLIAASLACSPGVVLADEPTTALDVTTQLQILKLLRDLALERSLSMLFVTHDFGVVAQLCDTVTVMYAGQTVETGPVRAVLDAPKHPYTRLLLACHPDRARELAGIPGAVPSPLSPPPGCRFHTRCPDARTICSAGRPRPVAVGGDQEVACVLYGGGAA